MNREGLSELKSLSFLYFKMRELKIVFLALSLRITQIIQKIRV